MNQNRRDFLKKVGAGSAYLSLAGVGGFLPTEAMAAGDIKLTILHTNDMHSRIEPFPNDGRRFGGFGGMARRASLIKKIRQTEKNVLLLDAGDIFQGTPYFNFYNGELEFKLMSEMGYDAATLGNHDFDNGMKGLKEQLPNANFSFVIANYDFSESILRGTFQPYKIFDKGGIKVGVFGIGIELKGLVDERLREGIKYLDPVAVSREVAQELKAQGCDFIICLSHLGYKYETDKISDLKLAEQVDDIDLIVGGHTHTFLDEPTKVIGRNGGEVLVNQVGWAGINLGKIDFIFSKTKKRKSVLSSSIKISEKSRSI